MARRAESVKTFELDQSLDCPVDAGIAGGFDGARVRRATGLDAWVAASEGAPDDAEDAALLRLPTGFGAVRGAAAGLTAVFGTAGFSTALTAGLPGVFASAAGLGSFACALADRTGFLRAVFPANPGLEAGVPVAVFFARLALGFGLRAGAGFGVAGVTSVFSAINGISKTERVTISAIFI